MKESLQHILSKRLAEAVRSATQSQDPTDARQWVRQCNDPRHGDYQFNGALPLAKSRKESPRDLAARIVEHLDIADICEPPEIAGPGFINLRLKAAFLSRLLAATPPADPTQRCDDLGIRVSKPPETVAIDMSSPNLAKEMHVGHLRSTVIGECVARILEFAGDHVERINHVGDWGTQFGMLLAHLQATKPEVLADPDHLVLGDLEAFYIDAKRHFDADPDFAEQARQTVVALQGGDPDVRRIWRAFCDESLRHCHAVFDKLGIRTLIDRGESFYNDSLPDVIDELTRLDMVEKNQGADCVFLDGFVSRDGSPLPMIVRKSDGGYNYATTDLAALRHRVRDLGATRIIYVVGAPQKQHFEMLFAAARKTGWAGDSVRLEHLAFGSVLGPDAKPFKTRDGGTVKLKDLLEEAVARARAVVRANVEGRTKDQSKERDFTDKQIDEIAETVGLSAVKYFELSHNLTTDYKFSWDHMLALDGNTAPYMLYAYARIRSIGRKAGVDLASLPPGAAIILEHATEIALAKTLLRFADVVELIADDLQPNVLTDYLFDLSKAFSRFYDRKLGVRVIDAEPKELRTSRLSLCDLTARVLKTGLYLLGINTLEQM